MSKPKQLNAVEFPPQLDLSGSHEHYPFCLVWSPLPMITTVLPFIGHVGIADSNGKLYDFQGDFKIGKDRMLFGKVVKYIDLSREFIPSAYTTPKGSPEAIMAEVEAYDKALMDTIQHFKQSQHYDFVRNNCHNFAAAALNANQATRSLWSVPKIMWRFVIQGKYVSFSRFLEAHCITLIAATIFICLIWLLLL